MSDLFDAVETELRGYDRRKAARKELLSGCLGVGLLLLLFGIFLGGPLLRLIRFLFQ